MVKRLAGIRAFTRTFRTSELDRQSRCRFDRPSTTRSAVSAICVPSGSVIQAYPFWSLAVFTIDVLGIYALAVYGGKRIRMDA
jgi:hypothetical protein